MEYKYVDISDSVQIPVPKGLTPDEEANYIAGRIGFMDFKQIEEECREMLKLSQEGKLTDFEMVFRGLEREYGEKNGETP